jgi:hypothetical protein
MGPGSARASRRDAPLSSLVRDDSGGGSDFECPIAKRVQLIILAARFASELCIVRDPSENGGRREGRALAAPVARQQQKSWRQSPQA